MRMDRTEGSALKSEERRMTVAVVVGLVAAVGRNGPWRPNRVGRFPVS